jgi:hypothetical protein
VNRVQLDIALNAITEGDPRADVATPVRLAFQTDPVAFAATTVRCVRLLAACPHGSMRQMALHSGLPADAIEGRCRWHDPAPLLLELGDLGIRAEHLIVALVSIGARVFMLDPRLCGGGRSRYPDWYATAGSMPTTWFGTDLPARKVAAWTRRQRRAGEARSWI